MKGVSYDIVAIKERLPALSAMFIRDGHQIRKAGSTHFVRCPLHEEKSPSCQVDDISGRFHCFGCGGGGDVFDYFQKTQGLTFQEALAQLAHIAGVGPEVHTTGVRVKPRPAPAKEAEKEPDPMTGDKLAQWHAATTRLAGDEREIQRIAEWRGIRPDCVRWAARAGLIGSIPYWGTQREGFLVEMPTAAGLMPVSVHIRLAPRSRGNEKSAKASWRYDPSKCGAWPFLIGDPSTADHIFMLEGQWDALALVSVMKWHEKEHWPRIAVIGLRGASSGAKFLCHEINPKAKLFAIADPDIAGSRWFEEGELLDKLTPRVRDIVAFWPTTSGLDFNDMVKSATIDRDSLIALLQPHLTPPKAKINPLTFNAWCKEHTADPDPTGRAATFIRHDKGKPKGRKPFKAWTRHWQTIQVPEELFGDLCLLWDAYSGKSTHHHS